MRRESSLPKRNGHRWCLGDLDIGKKLGEGCFGSVYLAREKESRFVIALKMLSKTEILTKELMQQVQREIEIQSHLKHPNIVRLFSYFYDRKRIYLMLEYIPKGELSKEISRLHRLSSQRAATYVYQLTHAIAYCHQNDVIHRDLKPENILLGARGEAKIADFGSAVHRPASRRTAPFGTLDYLAPEVVDPESSYEHPVDIWSLGILAFEMIFGRVPFTGETTKDVASQIRFGELTFPSEASEVAKDLITRMLQKDPEQRVVVAGILSHPWIAQHAEHSLTRCTAALLDWQSLSCCAQSSTCSSFQSTDRSVSSGESQSTNNQEIAADSIPLGN